MADITHDAAPVTDDGFHEIQLSGKQLVFLFMTATLLLAAVFLLGVQVGRGVKTERALEATTADVLTTATAPPAASTPSQPPASSGPQAAEPPAPPQEPEDELSYAKRLEGGSTPVEKLKPAPDTKPAQAPATKTAAPAATRNAPAATPSAPAATATAPAPTANAPAAIPAASPATSKPIASPASTGQAGAWVVQLVALKDRGDAAAMAKRLEGKGYPAFVLDPAAGAPPIYRVQMGGYPDRDHADQAARRIEKEEKIHGYVRSR